MKLTKYQKQAIVRSIMQDVPPIDKQKRRIALQAELVKVMSPETRKLYKKSPSALRTHHFGDIIYTGGWETRELVSGDVSKEKIADLTKQYEAEDESLRSAKRKLEHVVDGCSTLKQLQTLLPEFVSYMPTQTEPTKNLPSVANMAADLSKLGWPKK